MDDEGCSSCYTMIETCLLCCSLSLLNTYNLIDKERIIDR